MTKVWSRHGFGWVAALMLLILSGFGWGEAAAQSSYIEKRGVNNDKADELDSLAERLYGEHRRYEEAARLHERSAALRRAGDERALRSLHMASRLYYEAGQATAAVATLERLAELALSMGDVLRAGDAHVDAAWILSGEGRAEAALEHARRAELLSESPLLPICERTALRARLGLSRNRPDRSAVVGGHVIGSWQIP